MSKVKLLHFLNQFFAGEGGEEKADLPLATKEGPVGPGRRLQALLGDSAEIAVTAYCGDNYFASRMSDVVAALTNIAKDRDVSMVVAGPTFMAGRYGFACVEVCHAINTSLGLPCVTGMHQENSGLAAYRQHIDRGVFAVPTADSAAGMEEALSRIARLVAKLATGSALGSAADEGYLPRGFRLVETKTKNGAERAIDMLLAKTARAPFATEIPIATIEPIPVPPRLESLKDACLAMVSTAGVVPWENPDGFKGNRNTQWKKYSIERFGSMRDIQWKIMHGGYNTQFMEVNPNYGVPLDACRQLQSEGAFAKLYPYFYTTTGVGALYAEMEVIGSGIVQDMKIEGIDAAILVST
ncbi:MAG: glycine/betaine/sarcosine/D-proline family reductase selenoprotein B [Chloroflexi bacterium]|nr:glycine/betaine/sarcosine/D-proline family reductase selenoprotein B [Chloroflexota bacterium]